MPSPESRSAPGRPRKASAKAASKAKVARKATSSAKSRAKSAASYKPRGRLPSQATNRGRVAEIYERLNTEMPDAHCELTYTTPYQLLVSVVLSAQATDKMVNKVMEPLYSPRDKDAEPFTPDTVVGWGEAGILARIRQIGLAPTKAKNVYKLSQILIEDFAGEIPRSREDLEALPGVGRKTANVILGEIYGEPTLAVDTHVYRVGYRLALHREDGPPKAELALLKVIDPQYLPKLHHLFIFLGRYTCKAQKPQCDACVVADLCPTRPLELT